MLYHVAYQKDAGMTEGAAETVDEAKPPYISFTTLKNFLDKLGEGAMPPVIDKGYLDNYSGGTQAMLMQALRAMGLTDAQNRVLPALARAARDDAARKQTMRDFAETMYAEQLELAKMNGTSQQLAESFSKYKYTGSTLRKAIVFYLALVEYTGAPNSPNFKAPKATGGPAKRRKREDGGGGDAIGGGGAEPPAAPKPSGGAGEKVTVDFGDAGTVTLTVDVRWLNLSDEAFTALRRLIKDLEALGTDEAEEALDDDEDGSDP